MPLAAFENETRIKVRHDRISWENAWGDLLRVALYQHGPDVSEIGSTWLGSLSGMQALKPYSREDIDYLGGENAFDRSLWRSCSLPGEEGEVLAIPWYIDLHFLIFRRDLLVKAGLDEKLAFRDSLSFQDTLERLATTGLQFPLLFPVTNHNRYISMAASWIWGEGGTFRTPDGKHMALDAPESLRGLARCFNLHQFVSPTIRELGEGDVTRAFCKGKGAVLLGSDSHYFRILSGELAVEPAVRENLGVTLYPGVPLIGGTNLVTWRHSMFGAQTLDLVKYLTGSEIAKFIFDNYRILPARKGLLNTIIPATDPVHGLILKALDEGRMLRSHFRWAGVEARMQLFFEEMWKDLFENPEINIDTELRNRIVPLCERLNRTILSV